MDKEFLLSLYDTANKCGVLFQEIDSSVDDGIKKKAWAKIRHRDWIPAQVQQYAEEVNGCMAEWRSPDDGSGRPKCSGRFELLPLKDIYSDWSEELGLDSVAADSRLHQFKLIDLANQTVNVGLYHDQHQDPGLYFYQPGEGEAPYPLHVDLRGYVRLLAYSLGYDYWQLVLLELLPQDERNPSSWLEPVTPSFRRDMEAWVPAFDYNALVALYHEVKLKDYTPSGL